ncbi:MAG: DUF4939 domain-containing protein, partial [Metamycoplasmataceae bacterium]
MRLFTHIVGIQEINPLSLHLDSLSFYFPDRIIWPPMDPAKMEELQQFLSRMEQRVTHFEQEAAASAQARQDLARQVSELSVLFQRSLPPTAPASATSPLVPQQPSAGSLHEPRIPTPERYAGEPDLCRSFLTSCSLYFSQQPSCFPTEESKVAYTLTLLKGKAARWGTAVWESKDPCCTSFTALSTEIKKVFDREVAGREAARKLSVLQQGEGSVSDYLIEFRTLFVPFGGDLRPGSAASSGRPHHSGVASGLADEDSSRKKSASLQRIQRWRHGQSYQRSRAHAGGESSAFPRGEGAPQSGGSLPVLWWGGALPQPVSG